MRAILRVPKRGGVLRRSFPRAPVFPATLSARRADPARAEARGRVDGAGRAGVRLAARRVPGMKMRSFIPPGESPGALGSISPPTEELQGDGDDRRARERHERSPAGGSKSSTEQSHDSRQTTRRDHRAGAGHPGGERCGDDVEHAARGRSRIATISQFDASGFPVRIAAEVKDFDAAAAIEDRKLLKFANSFSSVRIGCGRGSDARRRDPPDRADRQALGLRGRNRHDGDGVRGPGATASPQRCGGRARCAARSSTTRWRTTPWCSAAARPPLVCPCCCVTSASAATPPRCTPPAPPAGRRSVPR